MSNKLRAIKRANSTSASAPAQPVAAAKKTVSLDELTAKYIEEADAEMNTGMQREIEATVARIRQAYQQTYGLKIEAVVQLFIRGQKLEGNWRLAEDRKSIVQE